MKHCFNTELAAEFGLIEAIILQNMGYWIGKNRAAKVNYIKGRHWTYNTVKELHKILYYLTYDQISGALNRLKKANIVMSANHNKNKFDRMLWYAFVNEEKMLDKLKGVKLEKKKLKIKKLTHFVISKIDILLSLNRYMEIPKSICENPEIECGKSLNRFLSGANSLYTNINTNINSDINTNGDNPQTPKKDFEKNHEEKKPTSSEEKEKNKKQKGGALKNKVTLHLFEESKVADFTDFEKAFQESDYTSFDLKYYYEVVKNWSASKGERKIDWVATSRNMMLRDLRDGKPKLNKSVKLINQENAITTTSTRQTGNYPAQKSRGHENIDIERLNELVDTIYSHR